LFGLINPDLLASEAAWMVFEEQFANLNKVRMAATVRNAHGLGAKKPDRRRSQQAGSGRNDATIPGRLEAEC
jgi:hypothetical protein